jgi:hypothetical protein
MSTHRARQNRSTPVRGDEHSCGSLGDQHLATCRCRPLPTADSTSPQRGSDLDHALLGGRRSAGSGHSCLARPIRRGCPIELVPRSTARLARWLRQRQWATALARNRLATTEQPHHQARKNRPPTITCCTELPRCLRIALSPARSHSPTDARQRVWRGGRGSLGAEDKCIQYHLMYTAVGGGKRASEQGLHA